ncbi:thioredoxin domain-containing protein [Desulfonatronum parangueonense]
MRMNNVIMSSPSLAEPNRKNVKNRYLSPITTPCHLTLFIAGYGVNSRLARKNLTAMHQAELVGCCTMQVVDILKDLAAAVSHGILVTPTLLISANNNSMMLEGNLGDREKIRTAIRSVLRLSMVEP